MVSIVFLLSVGLIILSFLLLRKQKEINSLEETLQDHIETQEIKIIKANLEGRDEERIRIAKDWHDGIGNSLSTLRLIFDNIQPKNQDAHTEALKLLEHTFQEFREIINNEYDDSFLDEVMIVTILEKWKQQLNLGNIEFVFNVYNLNKYNFCSIALKSHLYRITQELLANALKYANATKIKLSIKEEAEILELAYSDNGNGFSVDEMTENDLRSIKARVEILKGQLKINSTQGKGTAINIKLEFK